MKQLLLTLLCLLAVTAAAKADVGNWSFKAKQTIPDCTNGGTTTLTNATGSSKGTWTFTCTTSSTDGNSATNGPRFGAKNNGVEAGAKLVLTNSDIPANAVITEVSLTIQGNSQSSSSSWKLKINDQGGQNTTLSFSGNSSQTKSWSNLNLTGNEIVIEVAEKATYGFYLQGVKVTYTTSTGPSYPTECAEPVFNVTDGASVYPGQEVKATCSTPGSTVKLFVHDATIGDTYSVSTDDVNTSLTLKATASVQGETKVLTSEKSITVNVVPKPAARVFVPATQLEAGKNYILTSNLNNKIYVMGSTPGSSNIPAATTTFSDPSKIEFPFNEEGKYDYLILVLGEENVDGETQYYLSDGGKPTEIKYLNPGEGTSSNVLKFTHQTSTKVARFKGSISNNVTSIVFTCKTMRNKLFVNPNNNKPIFSSYSSKQSDYGDVMLYVEEVTTPTPTEVTVTFTGNADEYTVGQEGVSVGYTVTPAEAAQYVNFISSDTDAVTVAYNAENNALNLTFNQAAENVTVTASLAEGHESEYTLTPASFSFNVVTGQIEIKEPGQVKSDPVSEGGIFELNRGDRITFYSENAAKLKFELTYEAPEGETPYKLSFVENAPYIYTVTENIEEIIVTPLDAEETAYDDKAFTGMIYVISNPISETTVTFDYTKSSLIDESYSLKTGDDYTTVWTFNSPELRLFDASCNIQTGESSSFTYLENQGWKFNVDETNGNSYYLNLNSNEVDGTTYTIKKVVFRGDFEGNEYIEFSLPENSNGTMNANIWTGESTYQIFNITALEPFILSGIDVTYAHDEIESPYIFEKDGKVAISHSKTDHKIFYRVVNKKANAANRAPSAGETYNEYTTPLTVKSGDIVYAYAQHPHGMMSDNAVFDVDTYILTGVDGIEDAVEEDVEWFTLDGVRVAEPVKGMYIRVSNGKAQKIML